MSAARGQTAWRVLRTEIRRGVAPVAGLAIAGAGIAMLMADATAWAGRWASLAEQVRVALFVLAPLAVAAGAWQAGRERRRRSTELLGSVARPPWQLMVLIWAAVTVGCSAGLLVTWLVGAVLVAPVANYGGTGWPWTLIVAFVAVGACSAVGVALGRWIPGRLVAPVAGVAGFVALAAPTYRPDGWSWLTPALDWVGPGDEYLETSFQLIQLGWFAALAATALVLAGTRRLWTATVPAVAAVAFAVPIVTGPGEDRRQPDEAARLPVCTDDGPEVCLRRVNAFLLDDVAARVQPLLEQWEDVPGGYRRAAEPTISDGSETTADISIDGMVTWNGGFAEQDRWGTTIATVFAWNLREAAWETCDREGIDDSAFDAVLDVAEVAETWAGGNPYHAWVDEHGQPIEPEPRPESVRLQELPEADQTTWMGRYLAAARSCDTDEFADLMEELR